MTEREPNSQAFSALVADYLEDYHRYHPSLAAFGGEHKYDTEVEDFRPEAIRAEIENIKGHRRRLEQIDTRLLTTSARVDSRIISNNMSARLLELEELRSFETNPYIYCEGLSHSLLRMALFDYAPAVERMAAVAAKQEKIPALLAGARAQLKHPAPVLIEVGLQGFRGALSLIEEDLPAVFANTGDERLRARYQQSLDRARAALTEMIAYTDGELRARAHGDYALGARHYQARLRYEEGIDDSLEHLLALAQRELARTQAEFIELARRLYPKDEPLETWQRIQQQHPKAGELVAAAQAQLDRILKFIEERQLVSWPQSEKVQVAPTPDFYRWSFASMVAPGPLEKQAGAARYFITDVDPQWPAEKQAAHLTYFSDPILWAISIHEVYPGHYVQFMHLPKVVSRVRQSFCFMPMTYVEGWAHYSEQMMFEEGFLADQPEIRLGQLWEALLRLCRFIVAINLHTHEMSIDEGAQFFVDNAYAEAVPSRSEAERGTFDPMYLCYSLGKLEILKLREECRRLQGAKFSLADFHNRLLSEGMAPIACHRDLMLSE